MQRNQKRQTTIGIFLGVAVSAAALVMVVRWAGWEPLVGALAAVRVRFLILAALVFLVSMVARAAGWRILLGGTLPMRRVLAALNQGYLLNNLLPWRLGEAGRAILLGRRPGLTVLGVLSSIFLERLFDMILALALLLALLPWAVGLPGVLRSATLGGVVLITAAVGIWVMLKRPWWIERVLRAVPGGSRWGEYLHRFRQGLEMVRTPHRMGIGFAWMILSWGLAGVEYWLVLRAFLPQAEPVWAYFMLTVTLLGVAVPSSPGYVGVFEAAGVLALSVFGVASEMALAATLVLHAMVFSIATTLGAVALIADGETLAGLYGQARGWLATVRQVG